MSGASTQSRLVLPNIVGMGSCRIHNPLSALAADGKIAYLNNSFGPGGQIYMHAPNEMAQFCSIISGAKSLPAEIAKYAFLSSAQVVSPALMRFVDQADAAVIEICTDKEYSASGYALSINEIFRNTVERGGAAARIWWETINRGQRPDSAVIAGAKAELEASGGPLTEMDELVLRDLRYERLSRAGMEQKLSELVGLVGRPVLIVPHVRVRTPTGEWIENRNVHVSMVLDVARALKLAVMDPYALIERDGQERVLAKDGLDYNHYAADYLRNVGTAIIDALGQFSSPALPG